LLTIREKRNVQNIKNSDGTINRQYNYKVNGFNSKGKERTLELKSENKLKEKTYLEVLYDRKKGIISW
jgi:uncharacterized protein (TIGR01655 family)